jgi:hypothetical protein
MPESTILDIKLTRRARVWVVKARTILVQFGTIFIFTPPVLGL